MSRIIVVPPRVAGLTEREMEVLRLLALLLSAGSGAVMAQEPQPPDTPRPTEPIITESSGLEWVTMETENGEKRVLVTVNRLEAVQTVNVPKRASHKGDTAAPNAMVGVVRDTGGMFFITRLWIQAWLLVFLANWKEIYCDLAIATMDWSDFDLDRLSGKSGSTP